VITARLDLHHIGEYKSYRKREITEKGEVEDRINSQGKDGSVLRLPEEAREGEDTRGFIHLRTKLGIDVGQHSSKLLSILEIELKDIREGKTFSGHASDLQTHPKFVPSENVKN